MRFVRAARPLNAAFFMFILIAGVVAGGSYDPLSFALKSLLVILLWEFTVVLNDVYDEHIDRDNERDSPITLDLIGRKDYLWLGLIYALLSIIVSLVLGFIFLALSLTYLLAGAVYSVPPFRMRRYIIGTFFIGIGAVLAFMCGYMESSSFLFISNISGKAVLFAVIIFFSTSMGTTIKDIKDFRAEKRAGMRNVFTIYGIEKGKRIASIMLLISLLAPLLLFNSMPDLIAFPALASAAAIIFVRTEDQRLVMAVSFVIFLLSLIRIMP